jgi:hypothetical protein
MPSLTDPAPARSGAETRGYESDPGTGSGRGMGRGRGLMAKGLLAMVMAGMLAAVAAWWLLAEPVASPILWAFDKVHNHGVQEADLPGIAAMLLSAWLGLRGLRLWRQSRGATPAQGG